MVLFLQAPYLSATPGVVNDLLKHAAKIPFLNQLAAPGTGLPDFVEDPKGEHLVAQGDKSLTADELREAMIGFDGRKWRSSSV